MADKDGRHNNKNSSDSRPLKGIMNSFPTLDGNQISSDEEQEEEEQEEDSDPYIGAAYGSTYWNKGVLTLSLLTLRYDIHYTI